MGALLQVQDALVTFGGVRALDGVTFAIDSEETLGMIGPNGAGKSTLVNALSGVRRLTSGTIHFNGRPIDALRPHQRVALGLSRTFQKLRPFVGLTVEESLLVAAETVRREKPPALRVRAVLDLLRLSDRAGADVATLPYGFRRMAELGRALVVDPRIVLLDEPAAGLTSAERDTLVDIIRLIHSEYRMSLLLIEHDMDLINRLCSRVVVLAQGRLLAQGPYQAIRELPEVKEAYLGGGIS